jgi:hypothetical protein
MFRWPDALESTISEENIVLFPRPMAIHSFLVSIKEKRFYFSITLSCSLFVFSIKTLFGENVTKGGLNYTREYRGDGGGSRPDDGKGGKGPRP